MAPPKRTKKNPQSFRDYSLNGLRGLVRQYNKTVGLRGYTKMPHEQLVNHLETNFDLINGAIHFKGQRPGATAPAPPPPRPPRGGRPPPRGGPDDDDNDQPRPGGGQPRIPTTAKRPRGRPPKKIPPPSGRSAGSDDTPPQPPRPPQPRVGTPIMPPAIPRAKKRIALQPGGLATTRGLPVPGPSSPMQVATPPQSPAPQSPALSARTLTLSAAKKILQDQGFDIPKGPNATIQLAQTVINAMAANSGNTSLAFSQLTDNRSRASSGASVQDMTMAALRKELKQTGGFTINELKAMDKDALRQLVVAIRLQAPVGSRSTISTTSGPMQIASQRTVMSPEEVNRVAKRALSRMNLPPSQTTSPQRRKVLPPTPVQSLTPARKVVASAPDDFTYLKSLIDEQNKKLRILSQQSKTSADDDDDDPGPPPSIPPPPSQRTAPNRLKPVKAVRDKVAVKKKIDKKKKSKVTDILDDIEDKINSAEEDVKAGDARKAKRTLTLLDKEIEEAERKIQRMEKQVQTKQKREAKKKVTTKKMNRAVMKQDDGFDFLKDHVVTIVENIGDTVAEEQEELKDLEDDLETLKQEVSRGDKSIDAISRAQDVISSKISTILSSVVTSLSEQIDDVEVIIGDVYETTSVVSVQSQAGIRKRGRTIYDGLDDEIASKVSTINSTISSMEVTLEEIDERATYLQQGLMEAIKERGRADRRARIQQDRVSGRRKAVEELNETHKKLKEAQEEIENIVVAAEEIQTDVQELYDIYQDEDQFSIEVELDELRQRDQLLREGRRNAQPVRQTTGAVRPLVEKEDFTPEKKQRVGTAPRPARPPRQTGPTATRRTINVRARADSIANAMDLNGVDRDRALRAAIQGLSDEQIKELKKLLKDVYGIHKQVTIRKYKGKYDIQGNGLYL